jgi:serine protease Do
MAQAQTSKLLSDMVTKASGSLVVVKYTVELETGNRTGAGQAVCISPDGVFLTTSLDPRMRVEELKDFQLVLPGNEGKTLKAKLLGIDPWTGLGFVKCTEVYKWQVVQFSRTSQVKLGDEVMSIGLMMSDPSWPVYVGTGYVSSKLRVPNDLVFIVGGRLTGSCSPVFAADGRAIGIVGRQLPLNFEAPTDRGMAPLQLVDQQQAAFFTPVEEFVHILENIPADGKVARLPWLGINKFEAVNEDLAAILKLDKPGVKIDEVIPKQPAAKAGLGDRDIIVEMDGKPLEKLATPDLTVKNFVRLLMGMRVGTVVKLKVLSGTASKEVNVTLEEMPIRPNEAKQYFNKSIGLLIREKVPLDEFLLEKSGSSTVPGLIVVAMVKDSPVALAGLQGGDVITNVNNQPVKGVDTFKEIVEKSLAAGATQPIQLLIRRGEQAQVITVRPTTGS